jgi:anti-sigma B factor antagonist
MGNPGGSGAWRETPYTHSGISPNRGKPKDLPLYSESRTTLRLKTQKNDRLVVIFLEGELDIYTTGKLEAEMREFQERAEELILDLSGLDFMDGSGLRAIIEADRRAREQGTSLKIVEGSSPVRKVFHLTGFDQRLEFVPAPVFARKLEDL